MLPLRIILPLEVRGRRAQPSPAAGRSRTLESPSVLFEAKEDDVRDDSSHNHILNLHTRRPWIKGKPPPAGHGHACWRIDKVTLQVCS